MTVIEFFDRAALKNIASALLCNPDRVIMIGHDVRTIRESFNYFCPVIESHGKTVEFIARNADRNNVQEIIEVLSEIVKKYNDCVLDLTGGEDLYLVAVGSIMAMYPGRVQCQRFDFKNERLIDCDADGQTCKVETFDVSVDDLIALHGGKIVDNPYDRYYQEPWVLDDELHADVEEMWESMTNEFSGLSNPGAWNATMTCIGAACKKSAEPDSLSLSFGLREIGASITSGERRYLFVPWIMKNLKNRGIIEFYSFQNDKVSFKFKNKNIKRIMSKAGQLLELKVAYALQTIRDQDGERAFHDIRVGVVIDWEPESRRSSEENRSVNEIDIIAMNGAMPLFVSCKNGSFDSEELYKFNTVAELFGSEFVKKILITADMDRSCGDPDSLRERMDEMGIKRLEMVHQRGEAALARALRGLCGV